MSYLNKVFNILINKVGQKNKQLEPINQNSDDFSNIKLLNKSIYSLSEDMSLTEIESIYVNVILKQNFYADDYGADWHIVPYEKMAQILMNVFSPKRHLDIGCGKGLLVQAMRSLGAKSNGLDFSETLISKADKNIQKYLSVATAEDWFKQASLEDFDLITFTEVFEHLPVSSLENILKCLHDLYNKSLFITIPSYGLDANFKLGIEVNNDNPSWYRDMMENLPFKNIVLEDGIPHHGHITLASYRWWTEFFLFHGYSRNRDREAACVVNFYDTIKMYNWQPYILEKTQEVAKLTNCLKTGISLGCGWHKYEDFDGRWTDGLARLYFVEANLKPNGVKLTLSAPEINYIQECNLIITLDNLVKNNDDYKFKWITHFSSSSTEINRRSEKIDIKLDLVELLGENANNETASNCWRINIISPHFCPTEYGLSTDLRRLGVVIHSIDLQ